MERACKLRNEPAEFGSLNRLLLILLFAANCGIAFAQSVPPASQGTGSAHVDAAAEIDQQVDPAPENGSESMFPRIQITHFWLSGQMNFIFQAHPGFHAKYSGRNSLNPHYEKATSRLL
ncbi:MAG: hypothetical protein JOY93_08165, partial [Acidobacteriales bacterium]|nr:hypothetical protein [Terriglobales bacterium]